MRTAGTVPGCKGGLGGGGAGDEVVAEELWLAKVNTRAGVRISVRMETTPATHPAFCSRDNDCFVEPICTTVVYSTSLFFFGPSV